MIILTNSNVLTIYEHHTDTVILTWIAGKRGKKIKTHRTWYAFYYGTASQHFFVCLHMLLLLFFCYVVSICFPTHHSLWVRVPRILCNVNVIFSHDFHSMRIKCDGVEMKREEVREMGERSRDSRVEKQIQFNAYYSSNWHIQMNAYHVISLICNQLFRSHSIYVEAIKHFDYPCLPSYHLNKMADIHHPSRFFYPPWSPLYLSLITFHLTLMPFIRCCFSNQCGGNLGNGAYEINKIDFHHVVVGNFLLLFQHCFFVRDNIDTNSICSI